MSLDMTNLDLPPLTNEDMAQIMSGVDTQAVFANVTIKFTDGGTAAQKLTEAYIQWYANPANIGKDPSEFFNGEGQPLVAAVGDSVDTQDLQAQIIEGMAKQLGTTSEGVSTEMARRVATVYGAKVMPAVQQQIALSMQQYMTQYMTALSSQMESVFSNLGNAMGVNPDAFARAFQFNMNPEELTELMMSMMRVEERTYDNNLKKLGYADFAKPSEISIYPKDFESKEHVIEILDGYNEKMKVVDEDKVINYTDIVGVLMKSVTTIINMISTVLIAFVAISLIVSSIMIGVITYISVLERRKEIGILRAIGASKGDISRVFNAETVIEGLIAGLLGVGVTALGCIPANIIVYNIFDVPNVALLPVSAGVILVLISVFLTFIAGLIPSGSASRKDPVEALRSE